MAQAVRNLPEMQETQVQPLSQEDALEKEWHPLQCSCLENPMDGGAWRIPVMEEPGGLQSRGHKESDPTEQLSLSLCTQPSFFLSISGSIFPAFPVYL